MLLRLFFRLQCSTLFSLSRFPFHDSQVFFGAKKHGIYSVLATFGEKRVLRLSSWLGWAPGGLPGAILEPFWRPGGTPEEPQEGPEEPQEVQNATQEAPERPK